MKHKIGNLGDLSDFLQSLTVKALREAPKVITIAELSGEICEAEITEEPFLQNKYDSSDVGYTSELKRQHGPDFDRDNYTVLEPAGKIIFYAQ